jgi:hypothetical protein
MDDRMRQMQQERDAMFKRPAPQQPKFQEAENTLVQTMSMADREEMTQ